MILGEPMNVNEAGLDFRLDEDDSNEVILRLFLPKFLDTQLIDVDAQPKYVRVKIKGRDPRTRAGRSSDRTAPHQKNGI